MKDLNDSRQCRVSCYQAAVTTALTLTASAAFAGDFDTPNKKILVKPYIEIPGLNLELKSRGDQGKLVVWSPNYRAQSGVSLSYDGLIGVSVAGKSDVKQEDLELKGDTSYTDFRFRFPWRRLSIEVGYQKTQGFYAENTSSFSPGNATLKRPDLTLESKYLQVVTTLTPGQYSLAAAFDHSERQKTSGGSALATVQFVDTSFSDSQPLIPTELQSHFGAEALVQRGVFQSLNAGFGYGYMQKLGDITYLFGQILLGVGAQVGKTYSDTEEFSANESGFLTKIDLGIGANGEDMVGGLMVSVDSNSNKTSNAELARRLSLLQVFIGVRL